MQDVYGWLWIARSTTVPVHGEYIASQGLGAKSGVLSSEVDTVWPAEADASGPSTGSANMRRD
jgi:hypothetical protein